MTCPHPTLRKTGECPKCARARRDKARQFFCRCGRPSAGTRGRCQICREAAHPMKKKGPAYIPTPKERRMIELTLNRLAQARRARRGWALVA